MFTHQEGIDILADTYGADKSMTKRMSTRDIQRKSGEFQASNHVKKISADEFKKMSTLEQIDIVSNIYKFSGISHREIGEMFSVSATHISQLLQVTKLPESVAKTLKGHNISLGKLRSLSIYDGKEKLQKEAAQCLVEQKNRKNGRTAKRGTVSEIFSQLLTAIDKEKPSDKEISQMSISLLSKTVK